MGQKQWGASPEESLVYCQVSLNEPAQTWEIMQIWVLYRWIFWGFSFILSPLPEQGHFAQGHSPCTFLTSLLPADPRFLSLATCKKPTGITRWDQEQQELLFSCSSVKPKVINFPVKTLLIDETQLIAGKTPLFSIINIQDTSKKGRDVAEGKVQLLFH